MSQMYQGKNQSYFEGDRWEIYPYIDPLTGPVLDVGCGTGAFGAMLKQRVADDLEVWGVELMAEPAEQAAERLDKVLVGAVEDVLELIPDGYFSWITFNDSLEHMLDPYAVLEKAKIKLKPGGRILTCIPNIRHYEVLWALVIKAEWTYVDAGILDRTHLRFFTKSSALEMLRGAGLNVQSCNGIKNVHKKDRRKVKWFNRLTFGFFEDIVYTQFVCVSTVGQD